MKASISRIFFFSEFAYFRGCPLYHEACFLTLHYHLSFAQIQLNNHQIPLLIYLEPHPHPPMDKSSSRRHHCTYKHFNKGQYILLYKYFYKLEFELVSWLMIKCLADLQVKSQNAWRLRQLLLLPWAFLLWKNSRLILNFNFFINYSVILCNLYGHCLCLFFIPERSSFWSMLINKIYLEFNIIPLSVMN